MSKQPYGLRADSPFDRPDFTEDETDDFKQLTEFHAKGITFDLDHFSLELEESSLDLEDLSEAEFFNPVLKNRLFHLIKKRYHSFSIPHDSFINAELEFQRVSEAVYFYDADFLSQLIDDSGVSELTIYQELIQLINNSFNHYL